MDARPATAKDNPPEPFINQKKGGAPHGLLHESHILGILQQSPPKFLDHEGPAWLYGLRVYIFSTFSGAKVIAPCDPLSEGKYWRR